MFANYHHGTDSISTGFIYSKASFTQPFLNIAQFHRSICHHGILLLDVCRQYRPLYPTLRTCFQHILPSSIFHQERSEALHRSLTHFSNDLGKYFGLTTSTFLFRVFRQIGIHPRIWSDWPSAQYLLLCRMFGQMLFCSILSPA